MSVQEYKWKETNSKLAKYLKLDSLLRFDFFFQRNIGILQLQTCFIPVKPAEETKTIYELRNECYNKDIEQLLRASICSIHIRMMLLVVLKEV